VALFCQRKSACKASPCNMHRCDRTWSEHECKIQPPLEALSLQMLLNSNDSLVSRISLQNITVFYSHYVHMPHGLQTILYYLSDIQDVMQNLTCLLTKCGILFQCTVITPRYLCSQTVKFLFSLLDWHIITAVHTSNIHGFLSSK